MLAASLLIFGQAALPAYGLPADAQLDRNVALEARIEPLPDVLSRIGKLIGKPLTVERRMQGLKTTIFTSGRPARSTLAGIASLFDAEWTVTRDGNYRLAETVPSRNRRETYQKLQTALIRTAAEEHLRDGIKMARLPASEDAKIDESRARTSARIDGTAANVRELFRTLRPEAREGLWKGEVVHFVGEDSGAAAEPFLTKIADGIYAGGSLARGPSRTLLLLRFRPEERGIRYATLLPTSGSAMFWGLNGPNPNPLERTPFAKAQREWKLDPRSSTVPELDLPLRPFDPVVPRWTNREWTASDDLEAIHLATGIPILAEAFRQERAALAIPKTGTLRDALRTAQAGSAPLSGGLRIEGGSLLFRPEDHLFSRTIEPSDEAARRFDASPTAPPSAAFDGLAEFYAALPLPAMDHLREFVAVRNPEVSPEYAWALRLWGRLAPVERTAALRPEGLSFANLRAESHEAIREATIESILRNGGTFTGRLSVSDDPSPEYREAWQVDLALALIGLTPSDGFKLRAVRAIVRAPRFEGRSQSLKDWPKGLSLFLGDEAGHALRLDAPEPTDFVPRRW